MNKSSNTALSSLAISVCIGTLFNSVLVSPSLAGGFQLHPMIGPNGRAMSGIGLDSDDALTAAINPAGMSLFEKRSIAAGVNYVKTRSEIRDLDSSATLITPAGVLTSGSPGPSGRLRTSRGLPSIGYVSPSGSNGLKFDYGLTISSSFGLGSHYNKDWFGRNHALDSSLKTRELSLSAAWTPDSSNTWNFGAGLIVQDAEATLSNAKGLDPRLPIGVSEITGDGTAVGAVFGVVYQPNNVFRLGAAYRTGIEHDLDGDLTIEGTGPTDLATKATASISLPATLTLSGAYEFSDRFSMLGTVIWSEWSDWKELRAEFEGGLPPFVSPQNWEDSLTYSLGWTYRLHNDITLMAGIGLDETPIPNEKLRTPRNPDSTKTWYALGAKIPINQQWTLDLGARLIEPRTVRLNNTVDIFGGLPPGASSDRLHAEAKTQSAKVLSLQLRYHF